jgi:hypothetical protein
MSSGTSHTRALKWKVVTETADCLQGISDCTYQGRRRKPKYFFFLHGLRLILIAILSRGTDHCRSLFLVTPYGTCENDLSVDYKQRA